MVSYDELKEYLYELAYDRIGLDFVGPATKKDVWFIIGRTIYILKKKHIILPYNDCDLDDFINMQLDADFFNNLLGDYLGELNDNLKELYHVGNLKDIIEKWFCVELNSRYIGLYKDNIKVFCECGEQAVFMPRKRIEPGKRGYIYYCSCGRFVGVHAGTNIPFGIPADRETRALRIKCHELFDQRWKTPEERENAYRWLMGEMGLMKMQTHFGKFNKQQCLTAIQILQEQKSNFKKS